MIQLIFLTVLPYPKVNLEDFLKQAATDFITILNATPFETTPWIHAGNPTRNTLLYIATVLNRAEKLPN